MQSSTRLIIAAFLTVAIAPCLAAAQGEKLAKPETEAQTARPTPQPYILTLSVKETNGGKAILEKNFTLTVIADDTHFQRENLRDGDRIPYQSEKGQSYQDVGTNIDTSDATRRGEALVVRLSAESSSLVPTANFNPGNLPQVSRWDLAVVAVLLPDKPTVIYSTTDAISGHKVEIQATAKPVGSR